MSVYISRRRGLARQPLTCIASVVLVMMVLAGCAGGGDPAETVEAYLQAKIDADRDAIASLICSEMEADIDAEAATFATVQNPRIEGMACTAEDENTVTCEGEIIATYGTQDRAFELGGYRVVQEAGEWKYCGEAG